MDIENALALEYRAIHRILADRDFYEGVRSVVIDKDRNACWRSASLAEVSGEEVERHSEKLGMEEPTFSEEIPPGGATLANRP